MRIASMLGGFALCTARSAGFSGNIHQFSSSIHIPRPFSDQFRGLKMPLPPYKVQLRFGVFHEPWVTGVEIP